MIATSALKEQNVWIQKPKYDLAEKLYYEKLAQLALNSQKAAEVEVAEEIPKAVQPQEKVQEHPKKSPKECPEKGAPQSNTLAGEVAKAREHIKNSMQCIDNVTMTNISNSSGDAKLVSKINQLEKNNAELKQELSEMKKMLAKFEKLEIRVVSLEKELASTKATASKGSQHSPQTKAAPAKPKADDDDDGVDLFASDSEGEDAEAAKVKEQRLAEYAAKKSKKPALIAKSNIILDVKPWDDETDMKIMEKKVREITTDGLIWGASKLVPLAYGIHKLQISCVVEDDKVSVDWLTETIEEIEDYVQSVDIAAFNKV